MSRTLWTTRGELFLEYPVPRAGEMLGLIIHLTELKDFRAVTGAQVTVKLAKGSVPVEAKVGPSGSRGIYLPVLTFPEPGSYSGELRVEGKDLTETFVLEKVEVLAPQASVASTPEHEEPHEQGPGVETVSFTKEQQWTIPFRTVLAGKRQLVHSFRVLGEVRDKPGHSVQVYTPVDGRIAVEPPTMGTQVTRDSVLLEVAPFLSPEVDQPHLQQEEMQAEAELSKARTDLGRVEGLVAQGAMPAKELVAAQTQVTIAESKLASARQHRQTYLAAQQSGSRRLEPGQHFMITAPIDGEVTEVKVHRGQQVSRDTVLLHLDDLTRVWVEAKVFEPDLPQAREAIGATFTFPGFPRPFSLEELDGKIVHVGHHVTLESRTAPVVFEVSNTKEYFPIGGFVEVDILTNRSGNYLTVPVEAVMDDGAREVVFVHTAGEEFEKRDVFTGIEDRGHVAIEKGLEDGDRVVTVGAYEILLSTLGGALPEHGHSH